METQLRAKIYRSLLPVVAVSSFLLLLAGFYFWRESLVVGDVQLSQEPSQGVVSGVSVPENLPKDVPWYSPSQLLSSNVSSASAQYTFETRDSLTAVYRFFGIGFAEGGWEKVKETQIKDGVQIAFAKPGKTLELSLTVNLSDKKTIGVLYFAF